MRIVLSAVALAVLHAPALAVTFEDVSFVNSQGIRITGKLARTHWGGARPAVVMLHGCAGIYSYSDPVRGVAKLYTEWADRLTTAGYHALLVDSFTARGASQNQCGNGSAGTSEVGDRPHDAYAARAYLVSRKSKAATDPGRTFVVGWSHGGSSAFSALSDTMAQRKEGRFRAGFAFYPGCGLYNAFGGISTSTWMPYAAMAIYHGDIDPLFTSGYCQKRVELAVAAGSSEAMGNPVDLLVHPGAQHSFDNARQMGGGWTVYDVNAKTSADADVMNRLGQLAATP
ncbi:dienelactone hydrolase family protein [Ramlibacter rhizophilus]|uniref:Dienelactone hydrolase n=1 Tax=Ramlibacter rhizophilus TaxID=1781167 RepID=A0A4Z0C4B6_9BURK|nr:dienelactone hydrolase family protein [Ramlibacter rhizophilus]TFZ05035.1 dienelactone hydrolase [Ramlibacter rhizophilus]